MSSYTDCNFHLLICSELYFILFDDFTCAVGKNVYSFATEYALNVY